MAISGLTTPGTVANVHCPKCDNVLTFRFTRTHGWRLVSRSCTCTHTTPEWNALRAAAYRASKGG